MIFLGLKFWPKVIFWVCERPQDFFGLQEKTEGFFWVAKKGLRDFLGYAKKSSDFFGQTNSEVVIFWGIKYEPLSDPTPPPPPPSVKFGPLGYIYLSHALITWFVQLKLNTYLYLH